MKAHQIGYRQLNRNTDQRRALLRSLAREVIVRGRIVTTEARAKEARRYVDRLITHGKQGGLHHRRLALQLLPDPAVVKTVFDTLAPRYAERAGGYTRVLHMGNRRGDSAKMMLLELVQDE